MIELLGPQFPNGISRRSMLRIGGLAPFSLGLPELLAAQSTPSGSFGRAKGCLLIYMWGGPSHIDTFDMKPDAPSETRGEFQPISTAVPGIQICEHFPHLARQTDKIAFIRSVTHSDNNHSTSAHWMLTGHKHPLAQENFGARRSDFPHIGSVLSQLAPGPGDLPAFVALPQTIGTTAGFVTPGQDGGFLGGKFDPFRINQQPVADDFRVNDLRPSSGVDSSRFNDRLALRGQFDRMRAGLETADFDAIQGRAIDLVTSSKVRAAFDLPAEGRTERERYGMQPFGQSILLARRLLEAGVRLVTVYWHRDQSGEDNSWDTHADNFNGLRNRLIPQVDRPIANLLEDLASPRLARRHPCGLDIRIWPVPQDQRKGGPRSLGQGQYRLDGRSGCSRWANSWRDRQDRLRTGFRSSGSCGPHRNDLPSARPRPSEPDHRCPGPDVSGFRWAGADSGDWLTSHPPQLRIQLVHGYGHANGLKRDLALLIKLHLPIPGAPENLDLGFVGIGADEDEFLHRSDPLRGEVFFDPVLVLVPGHHFEPELGLLAKQFRLRFRFRFRS